ncbi:MAG TPA: anti-sigma F factor antagonist [Bacillota bacterium]|nr:anti-sigma F factor antagonist [Bacillota bacterium]
MSLIVSYEVTENVLIVRLVGELDHHEAEQLREEWAHKIYATGIKHIIVNLQDLTFMDSSGLGVLIGRYKEVLQLGGEMLVCHVNPFIERLFELSGLFKIVRLAENEKQALHTLGVAS